MSYIEGIGDEVINFFGILCVVFLGILAWWSTYTADLPEIRGVLIVRRRSQTVTTQDDTNNLSQHTDGLDTGQTDIDLRQENSLTVNSSNENKNELPVGANVLLTSKTASNQSGSKNTTAKAGNSNSNLENSSNNPNRENISNVVTEETSEQSDNVDGDIDNIRIRLKYLNDDQKLVDGRLQELLGDFKRRHFSMELAAQKLVRLIFNGQVLQRDDETLQGCGLYDNCVVHCLVHTQQNSNRPNNQQHSPPPDWNLGRLLYTSLVLILSVAWFCRYTYAHLFTLTSSTALVCLTCLFIISLVGYIIPPV